jgi:hypothetical protein
MTPLTFPFVIPSSVRRIFEPAARRAVIAGPARRVLQRKVRQRDFRLRSLPQRVRAIYQSDVSTPVLTLVIKQCDRLLDWRH